MFAMPRLRAGLPGLTALAAALLLAACNPAPPPQNGDGGGGPGGGGTVVCNSNADCPKSTPVCSGGICVSQASSGCTSDAQCDGGTCNTVTGQCTAAGGTSDGGGGSGTACQTANDCPVNQICKSGTCQAFDPNVACATNADCPRDHVCNALGGGTCQGCLNDNSCVGSPNGPKCDTGTGNGPGQGYCYKQCGSGVTTTCPSGTICDTSKGGLCVPACQSNTDCTGGLVCHGGQCQACTADSQCDPSQVCSQGTCVTKSGCTAASCQNLGQAYYCDSGSGTCQLGCTPACSGAPKDCNPCSAGQTCDTTSHTCSGGTTCNNCQSSGGCSSTQTCNTTTCTCVTPGGGGGGSGQIGDPCLQDSDCATQTGKTIGCYGAIAAFGIKGTCQEICNQKTLCLCSGTKQCYNSLGSIVLCALGATGECQ